MRLLPIARQGLVFEVGALTAPLASRVSARQPACRPRVVDADVAIHSRRPNQHRVSPDSPAKRSIVASIVVASSGRDAAWMPDSGDSQAASFGLPRGRTLPTAGRSS